MARLFVDISRLDRNFKQLKESCTHRGLKLLPITKLIMSRPDILGALHGLDRIADIYPSNLGRARTLLGVRTEILRPRSTDLPSLVQNCDAAFVSDPVLASRLSTLLQEPEYRRNEAFPVVLYLEYGDLRDGVPLEHASEVLKAIAAQPGIRADGVAINLGCLDGVLPHQHTLEHLADDLRSLRRSTGLPLERCSIGGSLFLTLINQHPVPPEITEIRMGEAWLCACSTSTQEQFGAYDPGVFTLELEVLEVWTKMVSGPGLGLNAQGTEANEPFRGRRMRAVLEGGENVAPYADLSPLATGCVMVGATHEYTVVDVDEMEDPPKVGDVMKFHPGYEAITRALLSPFVEVFLWES